MSRTPHDLLDEFPAEAEKIRSLKASDNHFARLAEEYEAVNEKVNRAEQRLDPMSEEEEEHLRVKRAALKDHIWRHLRA
ncbi:MAG: DUF465 domain-containing protein [Paracoccaceae bacterium]